VFEAMSVHTRLADNDLGVFVGQRGLLLQYMIVNMCNTHVIMACFISMSQSIMVQHRGTTLLVLDPGIILFKAIVKETKH
jgi:hypothetical protein